MNRFFKYFSPNRDVYFQLFKQIAINLAAIGALLVEFVNCESEPQRETIFNRISALEHTGDDLTHKVHLTLEKVYFSPFDRKDVHVFAKGLDDVADFIHESCERIQLYGISTITPAIKEIAQIIAKSCVEINIAVRELENKDKRPMIIDTCERIKKLESESDKIYYKAIARLYNEEKDAIELIKHSDILGSLEAAENECEDLAELIEMMLIKNY